MLTKLIYLNNPYSSIGSCLNMDNFGRERFVDIRLLLSIEALFELERSGNRACEWSDVLPIKVYVYEVNRHGRYYWVIAWELPVTLEFINITSQLVEWVSLQPPFDSLYLRHPIYISQSYVRSGHLLRLLKKKDSSTAQIYWRPLALNRRAQCSLTFGVRDRASLRHTRCPCSSAQWLDVWTTCWWLMDCRWSSSPNPALVVSLANFCKVG